MRRRTVITSSFPTSTLRWLTVRCLDCAAARRPVCRVPAYRQVSVASTGLTPASSELASTPMTSMTPPASKPHTSSAKCAVRITDIPSRTLHSSDSNLLSVTRVGTCFDSRIFAVTALTIWNTFSSRILKYVLPHAVLIANLWPLYFDTRVRIIKNYIVFFKYVI